MNLRHLHSTSITNFIFVCERLLKKFRGRGLSNSVKSLVVRYSEWRIRSECVLTDLFQNLYRCPRPLFSLVLHAFAVVFEPQTVLRNH